MSASTAMLFCPPLPPYRLEGQARVAMGRHPSCEFPVRRSDVSRRHAEVRLEDGLWIVRDLGSTNGTFLNGEEIEGDRELAPGDRIEIGSSVITFCEIDGSLGQVDAGLTAQTQIFERAPSFDAFHGDLTEIPPFAVLQVLEMGSKTGVLEVEGSDGTARLWFRDGAPVHSETEKQLGFDAAVQLVQTNQGRFRFEPKPVTDEATIRASVTELLLEASRLEDEARKD